MSAVLSDCGTYRYRLEREVDGLLGSKIVAFVMVNPSTAILGSAVSDDAIVRCPAGWS